MALDEYRAAMPSPEGYESCVPLAWPTSRNLADQTREMGLSVGDTIIGRAGDDDGAWWHEERLTLLWVGKSAAAFRVERRGKHGPKWTDDGEASNWTLDARKWFLANDEAETRRASEPRGPNKI